MNQKQLIEKAVVKVGTMQALAEEIGCNRPNLIAARDGDRPLPAYQAAKIAEIVGESPEIAYLTTLKTKASTDFERDLLGKLLRGFKAAAVTLTIAATLAATASWSSKSDASVRARDRGPINIMHRCANNRVFWRT